MERLTFEGDFCDIAMCLETRGGSFCEEGACSQRRVWERLKAYEDAEERVEADEKLFLRALYTFGAEAQTRMVFEEFSELQKELCKHSRGKDNRMEIAEEIADVQIMLEQMIILFNCRDAVEQWKQVKLLRLRGKMNNYKKEETENDN